MSLTRLMARSMRSDANGNDRSEQHVRQLLYEAERQSEIALCWMRVAAFVVLLALLGVLDFPGPHESHLVSEVVYGLATVGWLLLAWFRYHRPWLAWLMMTLDVGLVLHFYVMLVFYGGMPIEAALGVPGTLMIFLFLAHAAVRYRPALIVYGTLLFVAGWGTIHAAVDGAVQLHWTSRNDATELAFLVILALTATALFLATSRARRLLFDALSEARLRLSLARFVPPAVTEELAGAAAAALAPRAQAAAVMFVDVRGFTTLAEHMLPAEAVGFLKDYRHRVSRAITAHEGTIDKFIGDGVMAIFGIPRPSRSDAANAVRAGLAAIDAIGKWNIERRRNGLQTIAIGAGAHWGDVIVGAIGDDSRLEYTVIGDAVNVAQRLERIAAETGEAFVVSADLLTAARSEIRLGMWRELSVRSVRGRSQAIRLFAPPSILGPNDLPDVR